ncbi:ZIP family metal transporter [[Eubacterium] cellulosolvens]
MDYFVYSIIVVIGISCLSLIGVLALVLKENLLDNILFYLVSFASGAILGAAYFDLIPEALELIEVESAIVFIALGFVLFYLLERVVYWYHGHGHIERDQIKVSEVDERAGVKSFTYLNLIGDGVHNLIDGMVIGASFALSITTGIVASIAVMFHELPQEIGDFAILVYGGIQRLKALMWNFIVSLTAILGVIIVHAIFRSTQLVGILVGFAGGAFIYLSAAELIPELQKEKKLHKSVIQFILFIIAMIFIWGLVNYLPE